MSERRDFLKAAAVQLGVLSGSNTAAASSDSGRGGSDGSPQGQSSKGPAFTPPPQAPVEERNFPQYRLSGKPDPETNLLGSDRPLEGDEGGS